MDIIITSIEKHLTNPESKRYKLIQKNKQLYPQIQTYKSINGFNKEDVLSALKSSNLKLFNIHFKTFGALACFLTKVMVWKKQIEEQIPYLCLLEDDLELNENFLPFINEHKHELDNKDINILRCADWGECYITSLESAKRLIELLEQNGIWNNVDEQMWFSKEKCINSSISGFKWPHDGYQNNIFKLINQTNEGDILKTDPLPLTISETLFMGTYNDIKPSHIAKVIEKTQDNKNFLACGLNSMSLYLFKQLNENQTLETFEYGEPLIVKDFKKYSLNIPDSRFQLNDLCIDLNGNIDYQLLDRLNKCYGYYTEEYQPEIIVNIYSKIDYKKYDVFIVNGFARGFLTYFILQKANKGSKIFLTNSSRDWYNWVLEDRNIEILNDLDLKLITV